MKITLAAIFLLTPLPAIAQDYQPGFSHSQTCFRKQYRETYIPGTYASPGYVRSWQETVEVPCFSSGLGNSRHYSNHRNHHFSPSRSYPVANFNDYPSTKSSCSAGTTAGGLIGGSLAAVLSEKDAYGWSIPLGAVLGMGVANADC